MFLEINIAISCVGILTLQTRAIRLAEADVKISEVKWDDE